MHWREIVLGENMVVHQYDSKEKNVKNETLPDTSKKKVTPIPYSVWYMYDFIKKAKSLFNAVFDETIDILDTFH